MYGWKQHRIIDLHNNEEEEGDARKIVLRSASELEQVAEDSVQL